jgi:hypothetical protein
MAEGPGTSNQGDAGVDGMRQVWILINNELSAKQREFSRQSNSFAQVRQVSGGERPGDILVCQSMSQRGSRSHNGNYVASNEDEVFFTRPHVASI